MATGGEKWYDAALLSLSVEVLDIGWCKRCRRVRLLAEMLGLGGEEAAKNVSELKEGSWCFEGARVGGFVAQKRRQRRPKRRVCRRRRWWGTGVEASLYRCTVRRGQADEKSWCRGRAKGAAKQDG